MRRSFLTLTVCLMSAMLLAGCGAGTESTPQDKTESVKEETAPKETQEEPDQTEQGEDKTAETDTKQAQLDIKQAEKDLKEMSDALMGYLWVALMTESGNDVFDLGKGVDLKLTDSDKIRAAVLASEADYVIDSYFVLKDGKLAEDRNAETGPDGEGFHGMSVSNESVEKNCLDLFGEDADFEQLPKEPVCDLFDAVSYTENDVKCVLKIDSEVETETALENHECTVKEDNGKYTGEVNMFWGYWGELEQKPGYSNYVVTYTLEPNDRSKYKMAITAISVKQTENDQYEANEAGDGGLTEAKAQEIAEKLGNGKVCALEYHDYDGDGRNEAFAAIGKDDDWGGYILDSIWYIGNDENTKKMRDDFDDMSMYSNESGYYEPYRDENVGFFTGECGGYGSGWLTFIFGVRNGEAYEPDLSMKTEGFYQDESGAFYTLTDDFTDGHKYMITELTYDGTTGQFKKGTVTDKEWGI